MKTRKKLIFAFLALLIVLVPLYAANGQPRNPPERVDVIIEGRRIAAAVGDIVATGLRTANGHCQFPSYLVEIGGNEPGYASTTMRATKNCQLVVTEIQRQPFKEGVLPPSPEGDLQAPVEEGVSSGEAGTADLAPDTVSAAAAVRRFGWARESFYEQFGITVTQTHSEMTYWDDGSKVYGGAEASPYCWWRSGTGWYLISCTKTKSFSGPSAVRLSVKGTYDHSVFQIWHRTTATFTGRPGGVWNKACAFEGTIPPYWYTRCEGGSWVL